MTEQDNHQENTDTTTRQEPTTEDSANSDTSLVEMWDRSGKFEDMKESAVRFREFMENLINRSDQNAEETVQAIGLLGESFAEAGRSNEALISCEYLEDLYNKQDFVRIREGIAQGLVSIGSRLLDRNMRTHAIRVFNGIESLLREAEEPALRAFFARTISERGFALKEESWASNDESLMTESITAFTELEREFGQERSEPFEKLVAMGAYNMAGALGALGRLDEATACFKQVISRYQDSPDAAIREIAMFATIRERMMLAIPDPPPYIAPPMPETEINWFVEGVDADNYETVRPWFMEEDPEKRQATLEAFAKAASESHYKARQILMQYKIKAFPFVLLLRNFDQEGFTSMTGPKWPAETGLEPQAITMLNATPSRLEEEVAKATESYNSALTIANQSSLLEPAWIIPRIFLSEDNWKAIVQDLIRAAHTIVMGIEAMTPSIRWELECIKRCGRTYSTLIVLTVDDDALIRSVFRKAGGLDQESAFATKESTELAEFERVIAVDEIPTEGLASASALRDLLQDMEVTARLDSEGRVRHLARSLASHPGASFSG